jgi:hypothetical protein
VIVPAHIGGVPVEEIIPAAAGAGGALALARAWVAMTLRRRPAPQPASRARCRSKPGVESTRRSAVTHSAS